MNLADYLETMAINAGIGAMLMAVKSETTKAALKSKLALVVQDICAAYGWTVTIN